MSKQTLSKLGLKGMLTQLTTLYYEGNDREAYYRALQESQRRVSNAFPGLAVVLAEVNDPDYAPAMTHVLAPETAKTEHTLGWHEFYTAQLSLEDGKTTLSEVARLEVQIEDGTWLEGMVSAGGPAGQAYILTPHNGGQRFLRYGDRVRNITFKEEQ